MRNRKPSLKDRFLIAEKQAIPRCPTGQIGQLPALISCGDRTERVRRQGLMRLSINTYAPQEFSSTDRGGGVTDTMSYATNDVRRPKWFTVRPSPNRRRWQS